MLECLSILYEPMKYFNIITMCALHPFHSLPTHPIHILDYFSAILREFTQLLFPSIAKGNNVMENDNKKIFFFFM